MNLVNGAAVGALIPIGLSRLGIDPALAGGVVVTAATDCDRVPLLSWVSHSVAVVEAPKAVDQGDQR